MRVLLADDNAERASALARILAADPGIAIVRVRAGELLADAVAALAPDIVLVDMARPDRDALDGIRQVTAKNPRPIVLFVDEDDPAFMEEAIGAGVSSYNVLGVPPPDVKPILRAATALFRRHQQARDGQAHAESRLKERDVVDRAKAILIKERRLGEPEAYRWLRRQAMTSGKRIADVALALVREREGTAP
jgi:response regulator NasT